MTIAQTSDSNNGLVAPEQRTALQRRVQKAQDDYDLDFARVSRLKNRIKNLSEKLLSQAVYAGQKREKWLILLALQENAEANATVQPV